MKRGKPAGDPGSTFADPRLVAVYDAVNPINGYEGFYLGLSAALVVDAGCGTGRLACALARRGHRMVGVDPAPAMLDVARRRPDRAVDRGQRAAIPTTFS